MTIQFRTFIQSKRKVNQLSALFFIIVLLFSSCKKKENVIGSSIQPEGDQLGLEMVDTLSLITYTTLGDSVRTDELAGNSLLGSYYDPFFGTTKANLFAQIRLQSAIDFTPSSGDLNDIVIDSVFLYLELTGFYGNLQAQNFEVYQLGEDIYIDSTYHSNKIVTVNPLNLVPSGQGLIKPDPYSPAYLGATLQSKPLLKIPLSVTDFGRKIMDESGNVALQGNDAAGQFVEWYKGLMITVNSTGQAPNQGGIMYLDLLSANSKITMYYRDNSGLPSEYDTLKFDFNINANSARFNTFEFDYASNQVGAQLIDSTQGRQLSFHQNMGGVKTIVYFPYLNNLNSLGNIVVNKAQLILPTQFYINDPYIAPLQLSPTRRTAEGTLLLLPDFGEGEVGIFRAQTSSYSFILTRYVNQVISGVIPNSPLKLLSSNEALSANRVIFNGAQTVLRDQPKLIISYTKY
jgi:hypothetical protein